MVYFGYSLVRCKINSDQLKEQLLDLVREMHEIYNTSLKRYIPIVFFHEQRF
jgi:hypothetical protein